MKEKNILWFAVNSAYISFDNSNFQVSFPFQRFESPEFMIDYSSKCEYFDSGYVEDYDAWCWPFYIETKS